MYRGDEGTLRAVECRFFIVEKSVVMVYNKPLHYTGVTGDYGKLVLAGEACVL